MQFALSSCANNDNIIQLILLYIPYICGKSLYVISVNWYYSNIILLLHKIHYDFNANPSLFIIILLSEEPVLVSK